MGFTVRAAEHTGFTVRDLDQAVRLFTEALGFRELRRAHMAGEFAAQVTGVPGAEIAMAVVEAPGHRIELLQYLSPARHGQAPPRPNDPGAAHLAFEVDDLDAVLAAVEPFGWRPPGSPQVMATGPRAGTRFVYVQDQDGTTLEFVQPPA
ncbi:VOC family protein [Kutzneria viridogrisea]|uniref:Catechol 2,3-dioxygenase-like lactoylglutathione lyase family enzyme n=1 Tax=Kutzneria viridogrisea TaxID=47990 RepID=A0ABR6BXV9_9PSEU|nr:catechol 2,3-dioxygenase-like lactoylglutathione lyase family enzyme [Kutzneria viridogrisea]